MQKTLLKIHKKRNCGVCVFCKGLTVYRCTNCNAPYCKNVCQDKDWVRHKKICPKIIQRRIMENFQFGKYLYGKAALMYTQKRGYYLINDHDIHYEQVNSGAANICFSCFGRIMGDGVRIKCCKNGYRSKYRVCRKKECVKIHRFCRMPHPIGVCLLLPGFLLLMKHPPRKLPKDLWKMIYNFITI